MQQPIKDNGNNGSAGTIFKIEDSFHFIVPWVVTKDLWPRIWNFLSSREMASLKKRCGVLCYSPDLMKPLDKAQILNKMSPNFMSFPKIGRYKKGREIRKWNYKSLPYATGKYQEDIDAKGKKSICKY